MPNEVDAWFSGDTARHMKFEDIADVEKARSELEAVVAAWSEMKDG